VPVSNTDRLPLPVPDTWHHLESLAAEVHRTYFHKVPPLPVRWGQQISRKRRRTIRLGSYNHLTAEVRIHPILNAPQVPAFFVQSVIYHEYLHHILGPAHNRRFHKHERMYLYYRESQEWIRCNLFLLLGRKRSELRPPRIMPPAAPTPQMVLF
jgi:hypothetical protein